MQRLRLNRLYSMAGVRQATFTDDLKQAITKKWSADKPRVDELKKKHGETVVGQATVGQIYGGMRDILGLVYEPSLLDAQEGIRFRGLSIPECQEKLPKAPNGSEPLPEAMLYLLLTGSVPTEQQASALNEELNRRANDESVSLAKKVIADLPQNVHPMTQFSMGVLALQSASVFAKAYAEGKANKKNYWELALEDSLNCIARSPQVAGMIYSKMKTGKIDLPPINPKLDWAANFSNFLGFSDPVFYDCMRMYLTIHADHEGGNVSAHTTSLVGSALSDPYLAFSAGLNGLAGPLHGLANQEVLKYLFDTLARIKETNVNMNDRAAVKEALSKVTWELLDSGRVVPGYGHAVLRKTDPRYMCQREFALKHLKDNELFKLVDVIYEVMPEILIKHGKTKNPYPNVDAHSGVLLQHFGLVEQEFYTVLFGVSRQLGVLSSLVWDRLQGRPIERPKSITSEALFEQFKL